MYTYTAVYMYTYTAVYMYMYMYTAAYTYMYLCSAYEPVHERRHNAYMYRVYEDVDEPVGRFLAAGTS